MTNVKESIETINEFNSNGYDSLRQLADINMLTINKMMEKQMDAFSTMMASSMEQFKLVSEATDYQDVARGQMELSRKLGEDLMGNTRETVDLAQKAGDDYRAWFESNLSSASEQISKAAEKAA